MKPTTLKERFVEAAKDDKYCGDFFKDFFRTELLALADTIEAMDFRKDNIDAATLIRSKAAELN